VPPCLSCSLALWLSGSLSSGSLSLSLSLSLLCVSVSLSLLHVLCFSVSVYLSLSVSLCLSFLSFSPSESLCLRETGRQQGRGLPLCLFPRLSVLLSPCLSVSAPPRVSLSASFSVSLSLSLPLAPLWSRPAPSGLSVGATSRSYPRLKPGRLETKSLATRAFPSRVPRCSPRDWPREHVLGWEEVGRYSPPKIFELARQTAFSGSSPTLG
jgi:hypothetical protein